MYDVPDIEKTDYFWIDHSDPASFDVQITGDNGDGHTDYRPDAIDTSLVGVPDDREEVISISVKSLLEAARIKREAAELGVSIVYEQALRAGQIATGEVIVDADFRNGGNKAEVQEEMVIADDPEDEVVQDPENEQIVTAIAATIDTAETVVNEGVDATEQEEPTSDEHSGPALETEITEEPNNRVHDADEGSTSPVDDSPEVPGVPEENSEENSEEEADKAKPQRHYAQGQLRQILRELDSILGDDVAVNLNDRQKEAFPLLLGTAKNGAIAEELGVSRDEIPRMANRILNTIVAQAPEGAIPAELLEPAGHVVPNEPNSTIGGLLNTIRTGKGFSVDDVVQRLELSRSAITRFFAGTSHPNTTQILLPLLEMLGVPADETDAYIQVYKAERLKSNSTLKRQ